MFLRYNSLAILWGLLILILCSLPPSEFPESQPFKHFDKTVHFILFLQFTLLMIIGFKKQYEIKFLRKHSIRYSFIISFTYGFLIELSQKFIISNRGFDVLDLVADFFGTIFGVLVFFTIYGKTSK